MTDRIPSATEPSATGDETSLLQRTIDALSAHIAILDEHGTILFVNAAWKAIARQNRVMLIDCGVGANYLSACQARADTDPNARDVVDGIHDVLAGRTSECYLEYPCLSFAEQRWFALRVTSFLEGNSIRIVAAHEEITQRRLAQEQVLNDQQVLERLNRRLRRLNSRLRLRASLDGLTGVPNRRAFDLRLDREWRRCRRNGIPLSLAVLDVDSFKNFNDRYGHLAGDDCLKAIARTIKGRLRRASDFVARFGGEEFTILLPGTPAEGALQVCESIRQAVAGLGIVHEDSRADDHVTVSIGVASGLPDGQSPAVGIIERADAALYRAKQGGRNQTVLS